MNITVITALTNNNDELRDDFIGEAKHIAFLDKDSQRNNESYLWEVRDCCNDYDEPRRNAKVHKIIPHKFIEGLDISIWLDANVSLNVTPKELVKLWLDDKNITVCKHFERNCIYDEAEVIKYCKLDDPKLVDKQIAKYRKEKYPENNGMAECGVIIRKHTPEINKLSEKWWDEICKGSSRDQLSFPYAFKEYRKMDANCRFNPLFNYAEHTKERSNNYIKYYV